MKSELTPEKSAARAVLKAINRHVKANRVFEGGRSFGVDFVTWSICYPQMAQEFCRAAEIVTGRAGRYLPAPFCR